MIIKSLLDTDWYKITMLYAVFKLCQRLGIDIPIVTYRFKCRNAADLTIFEKEIRKEIESFQKLKFTKEEVKYILNVVQFEEEFGYLLLSINLRDVQAAVYEKNGQLGIEVEGPWIPAILFEVPVLSIVNEVYFRGKGSKVQANKNLTSFLNNTPKFFEFGTRRRRSFAWQEHVVKQAAAKGKVLGTSNVLLAKEMGSKPTGTMAHEWLMAFQAISRDLRNFQKEALEHWLLAFRGRNATALTDIIGIDAFLNDMDPLLIKNYTGLRWDSGCPFQFIDKVIKKYEEVRAHTPTLLFSDGLTDDSARRIQAYANSVGVGLYTFPCIGTFATNNWGDEPLQIVMKMVKLNGQNVVKLSDTPGKRMVEDCNMMQRLVKTFNLKGYK